VKNVAKTLWSGAIPLPRVLVPVVRPLFHLHSAMVRFLYWAAATFYVQPLFYSRCESVGRRVQVSRMPYVIGHTKFYIGNDVNFFGKVDVFSGALFDEPKLILKDRVDIGHNVVFVVNKEILIEEDVNVASGVRFMDSDAHPKDTMDRIADRPPKPEEVKPVRVCKYAWIGQNAFIMKGVTIGEGAIVGVNSVVVTDIPPYCLAMGNPARVVMKNLGSSENVSTSTRA
jgi:acetyltransferase-like isoleucine patch superfamily enzyme